MGSSEKGTPGLQMKVLSRGWIYLWFLWCIYVLSVPQLAGASSSQDDRRCRKFSTMETFEIGRSKGRLLEVHLRHNMKVKLFAYFFFLFCQ